MATPRPKIAETFIHETVRQREAQIGRRCEILSHTRIEYASLGDYSYLGENCEIADAAIGKFTAIANSVRIGAPNHPMGRPSQHRFTYCSEYYEATATRERATSFSTTTASASVASSTTWKRPSRKSTRSPTWRTSSATASGTAAEPSPLED